jgi:hypothetical protein
MQRTHPSAIAELKSHFDLVAYAKAMTGCSLSAPDAKGYYKLLGGHLGGLTVRSDGFYHHSAGVGGDALDFIAYLRFGVTCRDLPPGAFREIIDEVERWSMSSFRMMRSRPPHSRALDSSSQGTMMTEPDVQELRMPESPSTQSTVRQPFTVASNERQSSSPRSSRAIVETTAWHDVATYTYHDEEGRVLHYVNRQERTVHYADGGRHRRKRFFQWYYRADGERIWGIDGVRRVLYELPALLSGVRRQWLVIVVEGEKNADQLNDQFRHELSLDAVATTCPGGAGKWLPSYNEPLRNARVAIIGDDDPPGWRHVAMVARHLTGIARDVRVLSLDRFRDSAPIPHRHASAYRPQSATSHAIVPATAGTSTVHHGGSR